MDPTPTISRRCVLRRACRALPSYHPYCLLGIATRLPHAHSQTYYYHTTALWPYLLRPNYYDQTTMARPTMVIPTITNSLWPCLL